MTAKKSVKKSVNKSRVVGKPITGADDPRRGRGPKKGAPNAGRPADEFKAFCRRTLSNAAVAKACEAIVKNPDHPQWKGAVEWLSKYGYHELTQKVEIGADDSLSELIQRAFKR